MYSFQGATFTYGRSESYFHRYETSTYIRLGIRSLCRTSKLDEFVRPCVIEICTRQGWSCVSSKHRDMFVYEDNTSKDSHHYSI